MKKVQPCAFSSIVIKITAYIRKHCQSHFYYRLLTITMTIVYNDIRTCYSDGTDVF